MNITIEVGGPLAEAINRLADALVSAKQTDTIIEKASTKARAKKPDPASDPAPEVSEAPEPATGVTVEQVRARLAELSKAGKAGAVKEILAKYQAPSVSALKPEHYAAVLSDCESL
jgi:hypothetical protein